MGWRDVLKKYGPRVLTALAEAYLPAAVPPPVAPVPPVVAPPVADVPKPDYERRAKALYYDTLRRMPDAVELYEAVTLLEAGRGDELQRNLDGRK